MAILSARTVRQFANAFGFDIHRLPARDLTGLSLEIDLPHLLMTKSPVVFDVGANTGSTIELIHRAFSTPCIFSFEPNPILIERLKQRHGAHVVLEESAVGLTDGIADFHVTANDRLSSLLNINKQFDPVLGDGLFVEQTIRVKVLSIETYAREHNIPYIDLIYADAQGSELNVLRGAGSLLEQRKITTILVDVGFTGIYENECRLGEIQEFLFSKGYGFVSLYNPYRDHKSIRVATACFQREDDKKPSSTRN
jgi:FkbM family methyltransferase